MNYYKDSKEWQFLIHNAINWDTIIKFKYPKLPAPEGFQDKDEVMSTIDEFLTALASWSQESIAPRAKVLDQVGGGTMVDGQFVMSEPLKELYQEATEIGFMGMSADTKYGGLGLPYIASLLGAAFIGRSCSASYSQILFSTAMIDVTDRFATPELSQQIIPKIISGELSGSMCLTEPDAGSDLSAIRTIATKQDDGTYNINGTKHFITNGCGGLAFILAKTPGAEPGLKGLSLFLAFEDREDGTKNYEITKIEKKMGFNGSPTCEVVYKDTQATLVGQEGEGFLHMLHLMNEARISTGLQGVTGIERALDYAENYAKQRQQFGKPIYELPLMHKNFSDWRTELDGLRAFLVDTLYHYEIYGQLWWKDKQTEDLNEEEARLYKESKSWCRRRTPLVKYYGTELFTHLTQKTIQALGGYGYMKDYEAEQFHRDSFAPLLYEGTSQIQSLMAMKDLLKFVMTEPSKYFRSLFTERPLTGLAIGQYEVDSSFIVLRDQFKKNLGLLILRTLYPGFKGPNYLTALRSLFDVKQWRSETKLDELQTHAETLCQAMSYIETLRVLRDHARKDRSREDLFFKYKKVVYPKLVGLYASWE